VTSGDLACYVELSSLDWCHGESSLEALVGAAVVVTFETNLVADCESSEPCGRSMDVQGIASVTQVE
jgi:hypothetical protein